jgi:DNA (cytosine-5)-methyltransferase 1
VSGCHSAAGGFAEGGGEEPVAVHCAAMHRPTVIDLFAGAGLLSHAFRRESFDIRLAIEADHAAAATYAANLGRHVTVADVRSVPPRGRCDVLIAGPPCQGFSSLGTRDSSDPRNLLSLEVVRWAKHTQPNVVVIENVARFVESRVWRLAARALAQMGYGITSVVLNAFDFGVPQLRLRSFTIASRRGAPRIVSIGNHRVETVRQAWDGLPERPDGRNSHYAPAPSALALARLRCIPPGGDKRDVMRRAPALAPRSWWKMRSEATDVWGRMMWDRPSNTLRTCFNNASKGRYVHPEQHRVISLREAARLQSIPDSFRFVGWPIEIACQIGNGVPPTLGRAVARAVRNLWW